MWRPVSPHVHSARTRGRCGHGSGPASHPRTLAPVAILVPIHGYRSGCQSEGEKLFIEPKAHFSSIYTTISSQRDEDKGVRNLWDQRTQVPPPSVAQKKKPEPAAEKLALVSPPGPANPPLHRPRQDSELSSGEGLLQPVCSDHTRQLNTERDFQHCSQGLLPSHSKF